MTTDKKTNGLGIFGKMLVIMLAAALLPTGLIWYVSYRVQSKQLESAIHTRLSATADRLSTYTDQWLDAHLRMLRLAALDPDIISMDGARQAPTLRAINQEYPYIYLAHTIRATDGTNEGRSDGKSSLYYGDRQYFKDALNPAKGYGLEAAVGKTSGLPAFILAVPIYRDGQAVGALSAALLIEDISKQIVDSSIGRTGFAFLLDAKGRVVAHPEKEFARVRTGRASASLLDGIMVEYYGARTHLNSLATVNVPEPRLIVITPFDKGAMGEIERAIKGSDLGLNPMNDGRLIRIPIPELTEERRRDLVKQVHKLAEEGRVAVRNVRRDANDHLKKALKAGEITEDDERRGLKVVQDLTDEHIAKIDEQLKHKEHDILVI